MVMSKNAVVVRFDQVRFEYGERKHILEEVNFSVREGSKVTIMGQNGAGKSTIFALITGKIRPESGQISIENGLSIAMAAQVIAREDLELSIRAFFEKRFREKVYDIDPKIDAALEAVNLHAPHERIVKSFSGGQQARLLLASALITNPDLLLLDEPTNNLDKAGIEHLTTFLKNYEKTVIVISHDAKFLNSFSNGVLYLDIHTRKVEQYVGNYFDVVAEISARVEKERRKNAQLEKEIQANKDKANFFANKGGQMRLVARRMRDKADELEEEMVDTRKEDKTIHAFTIPFETDVVGPLLTITSFTTISPKNHKPLKRKKSITLRRDNHLLMHGPNGIGKTTLLESIVNGTAVGSTITKGVKAGYYRQDFSTLDFNDTVYQSLISAMKKPNEEEMRGVASGFLITANVMQSKIGDLSEGQKGLVAFARLVLEKPALLILDEPTNHINFRHLPVIADALSAYQGAMILVSHAPEFVEKIRIDEVLDLEK
ncbi:MAG: ATP-binding cassette domain-containing protein [bacterium]|nr:ATP-binding cassette domain-containing protein [bacterium]